MLFNSYLFILLFLPLCVCNFYSMERDWRHASNLPYRAGRAKQWLVAFSFWFYGFFHLRYLGIMLGSIGFNYLICTGILKARKKAGANLLLAAGVAGNLGLLFYFKYYDFFVGNLNALFGTNLALKHILLPLGISFFTFQQIGFLADAWRGEVKTVLQQNGRPGDRVSLLDYTLFVSFFPQLIAGPIVSFEEMAPQFFRIGKREFSWETFSRGVCLFVLGLGKKVLLADTFGRAVDFGYGNLSSLSGTDAALVILFYSLQLYFDFSGYCDMARGIGRMFGMEIPSNFDCPYRSAGPTEFWRRWHMTLNRFLTKYVYIPLGGSRRGTARLYGNLLLVFLISGLWHGAGWNFVIWGLLHGVACMLERIWQRGKDRTSEKMGPGKRFLSVAVTFLFVSFAWVFFRAPDTASALALFGRLIHGGFALPAAGICEGFQLSELWYVCKILHLDRLPGSFLYLCAAFTLFSLFLVFRGKNAQQYAERFTPKVSNMAALAVLGCWCVLSLSGVSTFLYFNF